MQINAKNLGYFRQPKMSLTPTRAPPPKHLQRVPSNKSVKFDPRPQIITPEIPPLDMGILNPKNSPNIDEYHHQPSRATTLKQYKTPSKIPLKPSKLRSGMKAQKLNLTQEMSRKFGGN
jgi:hypothetical protein